MLNGEKSRQRPNVTLIFRVKEVVIDGNDCLIPGLFRSRNPGIRTNISIPKSWDSSVGESGILTNVQGVRFNVGISSTRLKLTIVPQNWHYMAHFEENTPPFDILSRKSKDYFCC